MINHIELHKIISEIEVTRAEEDIKTKLIDLKNSQKWLTLVTSDYIYSNFLNEDIFNLKISYDKCTELIQACLNTNLKLILNN